MYIRYFRENTPSRNSISPFAQNFEPRRKLATNIFNETYDLRSCLFEVVGT